jgi:hypothetical protein
VQRELIVPVAKTEVSEQVYQQVRYDFVLQPE